MSSTCDPIYFFPRFRKLNSWQRAKYTSKYVVAVLAAQGFASIANVHTLNAEPKPFETNGNQICQIKHANFLG